MVLEGEQVKNHTQMVKKWFSPRILNMKEEISFFSSVIVQP